MEENKLRCCPFCGETEIYIVDGGKNVVITGDDGTVLYRFSVKWLEKLNN